METPKFLHVNISGRPYCLLTANILQHPESRLCKLLYAFYDTPTETSHDHYEDSKRSRFQPANPESPRRSVEQRDKAAKEWCDEIFYNNNKGEESKITSFDYECPTEPYLAEEMNDTTHLEPSHGQRASEISAAVERSRICSNPFGEMNSFFSPAPATVAVQPGNDHSALQLQVIGVKRNPANPQRCRDSCQLLHVPMNNSNALVEDVTHINLGAPTPELHRPTRCSERHSSFPSFQVHSPTSANNSTASGYRSTPKPVFYFMRSPTLFEATVLQSVATGASFSVPPSVDSGAMRAEMKYWGIEVSAQARRVTIRCNDEHGGKSNEKRYGAGMFGDDGELEVRERSDSVEEKRFTLARRFTRVRRVKSRGGQRKRYEGSRRQKINNVLECRGQYGKWTHIVSSLQLVTLSLILINVFLVVIDSIPAYHWSTIVSAHFLPVVHCSSLIPNTSFDGSGPYNLSIPPEERLHNAASEPMYAIPSETPHVHGVHSYWLMVVFRALDWVCTVWFTVEYILRAWSAQNRFCFILHPMSLIDLLATLPTYLELALGGSMYSEGRACRQRTVHELGALKVLRVFRLVRVFRVLKLARYERSFRTMAQCLQASARELSLLVVFLLISTVLFGSLLFFAERGQPDTPFTDIPNAVWWSIVTFFGYADSPPVGVWGKIVAGIAAIWGVVFMAFPISIMVNRFSDFYEKENPNSKNDDCAIM